MPDSAYHESLVQQAKDAIDGVFGDTSVSRSTTRLSLRELREMIDVAIDALGENGE